MSDLLSVHRSLLERFRSSMNLVGPGPIDSQFSDCERALEGFEAEGHWADLGSGAGLPGIPLAASHPHLRIDLVESRQKRCVFLNMVLAEAQVPADRVQVLKIRAEDLPESVYDGVIARAFAKPDAACGYARRVLKPGGRLVLLLNVEQPQPEQDDFEAVLTHRYRIDGKQRLRLELRFNPA